MAAKLSLLFVQYLNFAKQRKAQRLIQEASVSFPSCSSRLVFLCPLHSLCIPNLTAQHSPPGGKHEMQLRRNRQSSPFQATPRGERRTRMRFGNVIFHMNEACCHSTSLASSADFCKEKPGLTCAKPGCLPLAGPPFRTVSYPGSHL